MPEYVLRHKLKGDGLYTLCYQYFVQRWESTEIPEYDLDTDELVYRGNNGGELRRVRFGPDESSAGLRQEVEDRSFTTDPGTAKSPRHLDPKLLQVET